MKGYLRVRVKPSVYEVARLAGVSTATVSRVLTGYERVLPRTRDKVLTAVTELGYVPSGAARDLAAQRTGVLGLCFPDLDNEDGDAAYWYDEVIRGMERAARRSGYAVLIAASHHRDDSGLVLSIAGRCDGLVVLVQPHDAVGSLLREDDADVRQPARRAARRRLRARPRGGARRHVDGGVVPAAELRDRPRVRVEPPPAGAGLRPARGGEHLAQHRRRGRLPI